MSRGQGRHGAADLRSAFTGKYSVPDVKPSRDRSVRSSKIKCGTCGAAVGQQCVSANGAPRSAHTERRRMALRAGL
jgi:hypothetical protein